jgi:hypothetical protein
VLVGEEGVAGAHPAAATTRSGAASAPSRRRSAPAGAEPTGGGLPHRRWPPTPSARARHRRELSRAGAPSPSSTAATRVNKLPFWAFVRTRRPPVSSPLIIFLFLAVILLYKSSMNYDPFSREQIFPDFFEFSVYGLHLQMLSCR